MDNNDNNPKIIPDIDYVYPSKVTIKKSLIQGLGIFSTEDIKTDELIERCPLVPLAFRSRYHTDPQIYRYLYTQPLCPCQECKRHGFVLHMALGYGMIYNHQDEPNAVWKFNWEHSYADVIANKDILAGEEIYVNYGPNYFKDKEKIELNNAKNS